MNYDNRDDANPEIILERHFFRFSTSLCLNISLWILFLLHTYTLLLLSCLFRYLWAGMSPLSDFRSQHYFQVVYMHCSNRNWASLTYSHHNNALERTRFGTQKTTLAYLKMNTLDVLSQNDEKLRLRPSQEITESSTQERDCYLVEDGKFPTKRSLWGRYRFGFAGRWLVTCHDSLFETLLRCLWYVVSYHTTT